MKKVLNLFFTFVFILAFTASLASAQDSDSNKKTNPVTKNTSANVRMVEVDGHPMRVMTAGWDQMQPGQPIVVFESGLGGGLDVWRMVVPEVAAFAPVVAYDRAGLGQSPLDGQRPTPAYVNQRLHTLLDKIGARPPYVLVGHSWGGALIRYFSGRYPDEVAGLVYVDATDLTKTHAEQLAVFETIGAGEEGQQALQAFRKRMLTHAPPGIRPEAQVLLELLDEMDASERNLPPALKVPTVVLIAAAPRSGPPAPLPFDFAEFFKVSNRQKIQRATEDALGMPETTLVIATHSGHNIQFEDPALVVESVGRVVFPNIVRQLREAIATNGIEAATEKYHSLKRRYPPTRFQERLLNSLGYEFLYGGSIKQAIAIFELNIAEYPNASNPYDSLGEAYLAAGDTTRAIANYRHSLELNPTNQNAAAVIERLKRE